MKIRLNVRLDGKRHVVEVDAIQMVHHGARGILRSLVARLASVLRTSAVRIHQYATSLEK
jgi:hypothetical protein